ncbi:putative capsid protein [Dragonfly larvae associated circular virus-5]|uniref:putative capsid protein n=1 Tax=Dragonfly larvae associated circular virus-5 TaxID=1454026 RepID=UPI0003E81BB6|nr:putative capsid protein [Dragonfly larvae associated circular virus-5]AHH31470.1 putative capsid protein [Dragonfly larvae associated circular virus-5]AHH31473.1 putative capsid protein [Dragonfly larvae associated circular virus-5]ALE29842.1 coat protein [Dragonfly larvae associated circular virus-5]ALE29843.1 coat protein [Dragonfly larvae associated circular virus-5]
MVFRRRRVSRRRASRRRVRRTSRRRPRARRGRRNGGNSIMSSSIRMPHKYSEIFGLTFTGGSGVAGIYQFYLNYLEHPGYTGAGHQPMGFDQISALFNRYRVIGMSYHIALTNISGVYVAEYAVYYRPNMTVTNDFTAIMEGTGVLAKGHLGITSSGSDTRTHRGYVSVARARGVPRRNVMTESDYQAILGVAPNFLPSFNIAVVNQDASASVTLRVRVDLKFYTIWSDRKVMGTS